MIGEHSERVMQLNFQSGPFNCKDDINSGLNILFRMPGPTLIKKIVSKNKRRFRQDGFDLDLTYICGNIIAMGFPAEKIEGVYRNHISDVVRFLNSKHGDHYKVFNLCSERHYDPKKFHRVVNFPFDDHHPPPLRLMTAFCEELNKWLEADDRNVGAIHCKAGKGRTGVMICAYLLHCGHTAKALEVLDFYGKTRTKDGKGVTIPSQRRYVRYYELLLRQPNLVARAVQMTALQLCPIPTPTSASLSAPSFAVYKDQQRLFPSPGREIIIHNSGSSLFLTLNSPLMLIDDICIEVFHKPHKITKKEKLFHFWFNTSFLPAYNQLNGQALRPDEAKNDPNLTTSFDAQKLSLRHCLPPHTTSDDLALVLPKSELDRANKDKSHKIYSPDFKVVVYFRSTDGSSRTEASKLPGATSHSVTASAGATPVAQVAPFSSGPKSLTDEARSAKYLTPAAATSQRHATPVNHSPGIARCATSEDDLSDQSSEDEWEVEELSSRV